MQLVMSRLSARLRSSNAKPGKIFRVSFDSAAFITWSCCDYHLSHPRGKLLNQFYSSSNGVFARLQFSHKYRQWTSCADVDPSQA